MNKFSANSEKIIKELQPDLQLLLNEAIKIIDFSVICGYRGKEEQELAFRTGKSKAHFGFSKHNTYPASAVDIIPYPTGFSNEDNQILLAGIILGLANHMGIKIRWGADWNLNYRIEKYKEFIDMPHFELI